MTNENSYSHFLKWIKNFFSADKNLKKELYLYAVIVVFSIDIVNM